MVLWKQFKHQNLLPLVGAKWSPQSLMMISEWMEHGTIMDFVIAHPETNRLKLVGILPGVSNEHLLTSLQLADVARGLKYLHDWPSVHADLKGVSLTSDRLSQPQTDNTKNNILIDSNHSARIADFGLTSLLSHPSISISITAPTLGGTLQWMAPELFDGRSRPSRESDVYAFGMVIYEVCCIVFSSESVLMDHSHRFSPRSDHSLMFSTTLHPGWPLPECDPRDQRTLTFSACRTMSGR